MLLSELAVCGPGSGLPLERIDQKIDAFGKGGAVLDVMIADETEGSSLGKDWKVVVYRPIAEVKDKP